MLFCVCLFVFFCFKQKTAYEMRISDWSSDVCSSDLAITKCRIAPSYPSRPAAGGRGRERDLERNASFDADDARLAVPVDRRRLRDEINLVEDVVRERADADLAEVDADPKIDEDIIIEVDRARTEERRVGKESVGTCKTQR